MQKSLIIFLAWSRLSLYSGGGGEGTIARTISRERRENKSVLYVERDMSASFSIIKSARSILEDCWPVERLVRDIHD